MAGPSFNEQRTVSPREKLMLQAQDRQFPGGTANIRTVHQGEATSVYKWRSPNTRTQASEEPPAGP